MNIRKVASSFLIFLFLLVFGCGGYGGDSGKTLISISGTVDVGEIEEDINGPILVEVLTTDDLEKIEANPDDTIIKVITVNQSDYAFHIDLTDEDVKEGDEIYITAFVDNDYEGGIPFPTPEDYVGFYIDDERLTTSYIVKKGENDGIDIKISREVFDFEADIRGTVEGGETGEVTVLAYAGDITSSDLSKLDTDGIIGYRKLSKDDGPVSYTLDILPYGYNVPIENVYVFAFLDVNENGEVDGGDRIGYYTTEENNLPKHLTVNEGTTEDIDINFYMDVMEPTGLDISLVGSFGPPLNYDDESPPPIYVIVAESDNLDTLFDDPISAIKYFEKMPPGDFIFDIDLSETDLLPGDDVLVFALWDRDYVAGFPNPTRGDKLGLLQNKESYAFSIDLEYGVNRIPAEGYELELTKNVFDLHDFDYESKRGSIKYALDIDGAGIYDPERAQFIIMAIHVGGISINLSESLDLRDVIQIDMDYVLGVKVIPAEEYSEDPGNLNILPAIYKGITVNLENDPPEPLIEGEGYDPSEPETIQPDERTAYLVVILDKDGDGELDFDEDEIGYYCNKPIVINNETVDFILKYLGIDGIPDLLNYLLGLYYMPTPIQRIMKGENLDDTEDDTKPYAIRFYGLSLDPQ